jgi:hypothetical protein
MAYVDLNPIRAMMETTPEISQHTRIKQRIHALIKSEQPIKFMRFVGNHRQNMPKGIAYSLIDDCELVDCTGRCIREDKVGYIEHGHNPNLERIGFNTQQWLTLTTEFEQHFSTAVGSEHMLQQFKHHTTIKEFEGWQRPEPYFSPPEPQTGFLSVTNTTRLNHAACNLSWAAYLTAFK